MISTWQILHGDVRAMLAMLREGSVQCCVTSPPYWGLRDYGVDGQIGHESTPDEFVAVMVDVFRGVRRALADDGVCWMNLGDSYAATSKGTGGTNHGSRGLRTASPIRLDIGSLKPKDLVGIPWRVALALQADGWWLRSDCIWHKPNPMPESVTDRPTKAHEYVFLLTKSASYYYDESSVREPGCRAEWSIQKFKGGDLTRHHKSSVGPEKLDPTAGRNMRTVWTIPTQPYSGAHFATFPEELARRCIVAGSRTGDTVLDPFCGSGTTGALPLATDATSSASS